MYIVKNKTMPIYHFRYRRNAHGNQSNLIKNEQKASNESLPQVNTWLCSHLVNEDDQPEPPLLVYLNQQWIDDMDD